MQVSKMAGKTRAEFLYPMLKASLRHHLPDVVPYRLSNVAEDAKAYKKAKTPTAGYEEQHGQFPRTGVKKLLSCRTCHKSVVMTLHHDS